MKRFTKDEEKDASIPLSDKHTHACKEMLVGRQSKKKPCSAPYPGSHLLCKFKEIVSPLSLHNIYSTHGQRLCAPHLLAAGCGLRRLAAAQSSEDCPHRRPARCHRSSALCRGAHRMTVVAAAKAGN